MKRRSVYGSALSHRAPNHVYEFSSLLLPILQHGLKVVSREGRRQSTRHSRQYYCLFASVLSFYFSFVATNRILQLFLHQENCYCVSFPSSVFGYFCSRPIAAEEQKPKTEVVVRVCMLAIFHQKSVLFKFQLPRLVPFRTQKKVSKQDPQEDFPIQLAIWMSRALYCNY